MFGRTAHNKGVPCSNEQKEKISVFFKGRPSGKLGIKRPEFSGENHPRWVKDRSQLKDDYKDRGGSLHREWSKTVKGRDGWKCRISNHECEGKVVAHHILSWRDYPELRYEVNNGITLCHLHHPRKRNDEVRLEGLFQELIQSEQN